MTLLLELAGAGWLASLALTALFFLFAPEADDATHEPRPRQAPEGPRRAPWRILLGRPQRAKA